MEKTYSYFCAYMANTGEDKFFSSGVFEFPIRITTKQAVRAAERTIAEAYNLDRRRLHLTSIKGLGHAERKKTKENKELPYTLFCSYMYSKNDHLMISNTVVETDFIPSAASEVSALEALVKDQEKIPEETQLRISDYYKLEG